jgi:hypothetical protein
MGNMRAEKEIAQSVYVAETTGYLLNALFPEAFSEGNFLGYHRRLWGLCGISHDKRILKAAASASRRSLSEFVLESAHSRADEALADRRTFILSKPQWDAFLAAETLIRGR